MHLPCKVRGERLTGCGITPVLVAGGVVILQYESAVIIHMPIPIPHILVYHGSFRWIKGVNEGKNNQVHISYLARWLSRGSDFFRIVSDRLLRLGDR